MVEFGKRRIATVVTGVILHAAGETRIVAIEKDGVSLRAVTASVEGVAAMGIEDMAHYAEFLDRIRKKPLKTFFGAFEVIGGAANPVVVGVSGMRVATEDEARAAIRVDMDRSLGELDRQGIRPTMSAADLMDLMRGGDHDEDAGFSPSAGIAP